MAIFGGLAAVLTLLCDIHTLAEFLSIGTLIAFTIVCMDVCILRYCHIDLETSNSLSPQTKLLSEVSGVGVVFGFTDQNIFSLYIDELEGG